MATENCELTVFLLSPASLSGARAAQLTSPDADFETAVRFRSAEGVPIADAFSFLSSLYFRGKMAYARRFAAPPPTLGMGTPDDGILVIAPGFGLVPPGWRLDRERLAKMRTPVDLKNPDYCEPLRDHARQLHKLMPEPVRVVLLGSVATGKYVDVLAPVFGDQLRFPRLFAGAGNMQRGSMMLRAAREGQELGYVTLDAPRSSTRLRCE